jgi:hypothetical protein
MVFWMQDKLRSWLSLVRDSTLTGREEGRNLTDSTNRRGTIEIRRPALRSDPDFERQKLKQAESEHVQVVYACH